jgi:anti-sigma B factor antagonist
MRFTEAKDARSATAWREGCEMEQQENDWGAFVLVVRGELDVATVDEMRKALHDAATGGASRILVDLTDVSFIDSVSMAAIVGTKRRMGPGGRLAVAASHPYVLLVVEAVGLQHVVDVLPTREEAEAHLKA